MRSENRIQNRSLPFLTILVALFLVFESEAQDLEPRFLSALPTRGNFAIVSYGYSYGNILLDNTLPIENLQSSLNNIVVGYARSFRLFGRLAKFDAIIPYSFAHFSGEVSQIDTSTNRNGFGDPLFRISVILIGTRAMKADEFFKTPQKNFNLGVQLRIRPPLGQYYPDKLLNLGANRWAFKLGLAASYSFKKKLILEGHFISWFFTANNNFYNGSVVKQEPMISGQFHISYVFKPGIWLAVSLGTGGLGKTTLNGVDQENTQKNSRFGAAFAFRINKHHALKIAYTSGFSTRYGADFNTMLVAYQFMWFDKMKNKEKNIRFEWL